MSAFKQTGGEKGGIKAGGSQPPQSD